MHNKLRWSSYIIFIYIYTGHVHVVLVPFPFETSQASGVDRFTSKEVSSSLRGAATGFSLATGIGASTTASGINVTSSAPAMNCLFKTEVLLIYEWSSREPYEWNVTSLYCTPNFM